MAKAKRVRVTGTIAVEETWLGVISRTQMNSV
jgi:hypothetical protein